MTSQEIKEKTFEKAVFGGYDMGAVDNFMDELAEDFAVQGKEISTLKAKMKVLVDKIEEYRANEDALNGALLAAQKLSAEIESEARDKSDAVLREAQDAAREMVGAVTLEVEAQEARLIDAKRSFAEYLEKMRSVCLKQLDFLDVVSEMKITDTEPAARPAPEVSEPLAESEEEDEASSGDMGDFLVEFTTEASEITDYGPEFEEEPAAVESYFEEETPGLFETDVYDGDDEPTRQFPSQRAAGEPAKPRFSFEELRFDDDNE